MDTLKPHSKGPLHSNTVIGTLAADIPVHLHSNSLMGTLKQQSNKLLYNNTVTGTPSTDGWAVIFVQWWGDWVGLHGAQAPPHCTKCNTPPINGQCTNFILFDVAQASKQAYLFTKAGY